METVADLHSPLGDALQKLKSLELIYERASFPEHICFFKHALTQEVAYDSLLLHRRKELHCLIAAAVEELHATRLPESYGLLAYHYERGEEWDRALDYLRRAADRCRAIGAYREAAVQLSRALEIAQRLGYGEVINELRGQRGAALVKVGRWADARPDLESALAETPSLECGRRAELMSNLAAACFWALDIPGMQRYAVEGHALAEEADRKDLATELLGWLGAGKQAEGSLVAATDLFERALARGSGYCSAGLANYPLTLYLRGHLHQAVQHAQQSAAAFHDLSDAFASTFGHPHLGLALAACGRYTEATRVFEEARQLGEKHEVWAFHARAVAMSAGFHLDVYDWPGHEELAEEARDRARSAGFRPSEVSASIDLVFNYVRQGRTAAAERVVQDAAVLAAQIGGWHQWLWALRLRQAKAELALACDDLPRTVELASGAIAESQARGRTKYWAAGLETRGRALAALGRTAEAVADLGKAVALARSMDDPALVLRCVTSTLTVGGTDELLTEGCNAARRIWAELPTDSMRQRFTRTTPTELLKPE